MFIMVYQAYSAYKQVSKQGYRVITVQEGNTGSVKDVPYLLEFDDCKVDLTIVVPCYNESKRFPITFDETYKYLEGLKQRKDLKIEMVLVNDGSRDET